jgi:hypothetical protein
LSVAKELTDQEVQDHVRVHVERSRVLRARRLAEVLGTQNAGRLAGAAEARAFVRRIVKSIRDV